MRLKVLNRIDGSYNLNFHLQDVKDNSRWVGKISRKLSPFNLDFIDLDERAILASRLASLMDINIPESKYITEAEILPSAIRTEILTNAKSDDHYYNSEKILITKYAGKPLPVYIEKKGIDKVSNSEDMIKSIVFDLWIGNYDRKDSDYTIKNSGIAHSIDYNLSGPGFQEDNINSLGFWALPFSIDTPGDTSYAIGDIFRNQIIEQKLNIDFFEEELNKLESLTDNLIADNFVGLNFYEETTHRVINEEYIFFLIRRKNQIRNSLTQWIESGYSRSNKRR